MSARKKNVYKLENNMHFTIIVAGNQAYWCNWYTLFIALRGVEWVHGLFLFPLVLGKM